MNEKLKRINLFLLFFVLLTLNISGQSLFKIVGKSGKYGFINSNGKVVIPPKFECVENFQEGLTAVFVGGKWGYIDTLGNISIEPRFDRAYAFSEELALVFTDTKCGYINETGEFVIQPQFTAGGYFSNGLVCVQNSSNTWSFINRESEVIIDKIQTYEFECSYGTCMEIPVYSSGMVNSNDNTLGKVYFYNTKGKRKRFPSTVGYEFSDGVIYFKDNETNNTGYLDTKKKVIIEPKYKLGSNFINGNAWVIEKIDSIYVVKKIDKNDAILFSETLNDTSFTQLINVGNNTCLLFYQDYNLYINTNGERLIIEKDKKLHNKPCPEVNMLGVNKPKWENELFAIYENGEITKYLNIKGDIVWEREVE